MSRKRLQKKRIAGKYSTEDVEAMIAANDAPAGLTVPGKLNLAGKTSVRRLPPGLTVGWIDLTDCANLESLPPDLRARRITLAGKWNPRHLLAGLRCYQLDLQHTTLTDLPANLRVEHRLDLENAAALESLPEKLKVGCLVLRNCAALTALPEGLECYFLDMSGCVNLEGWPRHASVSVGRFAARGCLQIRALPPWLTSVAQLDLRDCVNVRELPEGLTVSSWIDVAGTRIRSLPPALERVQLRWRGVPVEPRIAFLPETITAEEILAEPNAERRRVMLERMGYDTFLAHAKAEVIDEDRDAGGLRRLVRVPMANDEDLVCVSVICPSTQRQYVIRVPPTTRSCHQAAAWVAGFDDPNDYKPLVET